MWRGLAVHDGIWYCGRMDREMLLDHLALAERHILQGEAHLTAQRALIARLDRNGHDARPARDLLDLFEDLQRVHIADRDRLLRELAD